MFAIREDRTEVRMADFEAAYEKIEAASENDEPVTGLTHYQ
jgi:ATP-dependent 26S proteasome regulatory subunit